MVLAGPFVRNPKTSAMRRLLLRVAMAPPWAAISWKSYLPKLYAGRRPADFGEYRDQVIASIRRPGYAKAFSRTTRTSHDPAERRLGEVTAPALVVMGEQDPDFPDPRAEAGWIARALHAQVVMVPEARHYPQSQRPDITTGAVLSFLESVNGPAQAGLTQPSMPQEAGRIADEVTQSRGPEVTAAGSPAPPLPDQQHSDRKDQEAACMTGNSSPAPGDPLRKYPLSEAPPRGIGSPR